ncbi:MFS transporter, MHS family, proline/betaine transporter [Desulfatibacillum alkenivorans DSM 16219]|uniref:MFS transporter, MHS family, proline/betaine transporter n=1 Tax=Desulfatibacillum alkenivorans DSM 16219 TaxID=1121393 RepID=A0A1M6C358_9BACT|nr:MFS transporter [Desulfatibacillum alkenivorans]SHI55450.1 MFS transporter, MHS family, proline/betaine transporter [Desulfatibacillum alkenivorans DSM 16219]
MSISKRYTTLLAGFIGNVIEWYDFALYGYMAGILSKLFFPNESEVASLIATYGVFAAGFVMRPIGSFVFGWMGDTLGRSKTMMVSITMMVFPTFLLGCLPTFDAVGIWAPVLLVITRMVQGLSVGGEFSSSVTYLVETAPPEKRGLSGSWANTGSLFGMLLGAGAAAVVTSFFSHATIMDWAWRTPFLLGGVLGAASITMRRNLPQSEHFVQHHDNREATSPLLEVFTTNRSQTIKALIFASAYGVLFYIPLVYLPEWLHRYAGLKLDAALIINTAGTAVLLLLIPFSGMIGDRLMRRTKFIAAAMLGAAMVSWPLYVWLETAGISGAIIGQLILAVLIAAPLGSAPAMFVELFPARDRLSGYSVAYNLGLGVVGGTTPMVCTWLIDVSGKAYSPGLYMAGMAVVAFGALLLIKDGSREPLP